MTHFTLSHPNITGTGSSWTFSVKVSGVETAKMYFAEVNKVPISEVEVNYS
jgi:hypothetical protein